ncbi:hypothetical protein GCM10007301_20540 [Azorhizobium oxalatiphilum]|uniref:Uncharacterized protein n=1 Tax=Azorhizobium oxalatiphilum TaxID=980631 RepID=A0A917FBY9_9HYPH|nr:hypothetical protein [Azorhizobium oxalatiphilum]GGF60686.1 hypothetical protein GCM10007301_20540 [Azorhizobium oxalatiphilum]
MPGITHSPRFKGSIAFGLALALCTAGTVPALADCQTDFMALRSDMDAKGKLLQAAGKNKSGPQELCPLFRSYTTAEAKAAQYLKENKDWCQIPEETIKAALANNVKTAQLRDRVCQAAASGAGAGGGGPAKPPPQGSLSQALGVTTGYVPGESSNRGGVFDTLTGNALSK